MWEHLLPGLAVPAEKPSRRRGCEKIGYKERIQGRGLSGAERQRAYKQRFIAEHGLKAWQDRYNAAGRRAYRAAMAEKE